MHPDQRGKIRERLVIGTDLGAWKGESRGKGSELGNIGGEDGFDEQGL